MNGLREIIEAADRARRHRRPVVLATVVKVAGSTYRRPGACMLIPDQGEPVGMVSGGCLESDLAERARAVLESGAAQTVVYDMRSPDDIVWGLGLGCNGEVRVLLERLAPGSAPGRLAFLDRCTRARRAGVVVTVFEGSEELASAVGQHLTLGETEAASGSIGEPRLRSAVLEDARRALADHRSAVRHYEIEGGRAEALVEYVAPAVSLLVFGAGNDALPLVEFAKTLGWQVTVADDRPAFAAPERFPAADAVKLVRFDALDREELPIDAHTAVIAMTHHFLHDLELLRFLLPTAAPYLGLLGPRQRTENLLEELAKRGVQPTASQLHRLYGPVGLDIGAETPEEIALTVACEIRAVLSDRRGGFLRDRRGPLHEWPQ
jgi:xanthine/CO dehydrogenase XdhC/CoxF family maturation factor